MFKKLTSFSYKRNIVEGIGFYLAYLLLILITAVVCAMLTSVVTGNSSFLLGAIIGKIIALLLTGAIGCMVLYKKKLGKNILFVFLVILSAVLSYYTGAIVGMAIIAYLTTR